jgi:hypothetical protein
MVVSIPGTGTMVFLKTVTFMETGKTEYGKTAISVVNGRVVLILHRYKKLTQKTMKRKRITLEQKQEKEILNQRELRVTKEGNEYFFEIGPEMTSDVAEAVSILMRKIDWNDPIWNTVIDKKMIYENITPEKALYWLSGGYKEWKSLDHYNRPWCDCYLDFQEEFGFLIVNIIKKSKTLLDVRNAFMKYLNLPTLYNFAISKNMVRI